MRKQQRLRRPLNKRFIPNLITLINMFLGFMALGLLLKGEVVKAGWLVLFAGAFDAVDGKLARLLGLSNKFGTEFDSLADTVSFCVVPSLMVYMLYVTGLHPVIAGIISFFPLLFGTIRLARFNLAADEPKSYFIGLTTPLNALMIVSYMLFNQQLYNFPGDPRVALVMVSALSFLMVSRVRFGKFPLLSFKHSRSNTLQLIGVMVMTITVILWRGLVLFPLLTVYVVGSIIRWIIIHNRLDADLLARQPGHHENG